MTDQNAFAPVAPLVEPEHRKVSAADLGKTPTRADAVRRAGSTKTTITHSRDSRLQKC